MDALNQDQAIAVIGMGCRFPGAPGIDEFWKVLTANTDAVTRVPRDRFDIAAYHSPEPTTPGRTVSAHGGFLSDPFSFDASFFGISPAEARGIDPQQRLLLPVVLEALEAAGIAPGSLAGSRTGVFIGQATGEYALEVDLRQHSIGDATGSHLRAMTPGRVSYALDLRGPSLTIDTACSSSLVAVHTARQSLLAGESDLAVAGGVNLILSPQDAIAYSQAGMLSPDGRCKFGNAGADGFVRSEGVGAVVLKRLRDALRDGDPVLACLLGSAVTNDGRGSGLLLKPAVSGQVDMMREACRIAGITPSQLDYVEAHGTGTPVGDGVELRAMAEVSSGRAADRPLLTGSVKSNIGHAEAAAGIAGLIKAVLIARHGVVPASLHVGTPHRLLADPAVPVSVVTANQALTRGAEPALLGVSSFGLSGTNAHVVVGEYLPTRAEETVTGDGRGSAELPPGRPTHLLVLSAGSERSLRTQALAFADFLGPEGAGRRQPLWDVCASAALRRDAHPYRLWAVGSSHGELADQLRALVAGEPLSNGGFGEAGFGPVGHTVFVFPGQGSQWLGMGCSLLRSSADFREALTACDAAVLAEAGWSVIEVLTSPAEELPVAVDRIQPTLWAVMVALAATWRGMGVEPGAVIGQSMGEVAAACVSGALSLADAAAVICRRSRLMQQLAGTGAMLAAEITLREGEELSAAHGGRVSVAVENAPTSTVLAGDTEALRQIGLELEQRGVHSRQVKVNVASHSALMDPLRGELLAVLDGLTPVRAGLTLISTVRSTTLDGPELTAEYWMDNLRRPVRFAEGVRLAAKEQGGVFIEVSPHPLLRAAMEETLEVAGSDAVVVSSCRRGQDEPLDLARALGQVFAHGGEVRWERWFAAPVRHVALPRYSWDEQSLRRAPVRTAPVEHVRDFPQDQRILGVDLRGITPIPSTVHLLAALDAARSVSDGQSFALEEAALGVEFVDLAGQGGVTLRSRLVERPEGGYRVSVEALTPGGPVVCLTAGLRALGEDPPAEIRDELDRSLARCGRYLSAADFLRLAEARGYRIEAPFQAVRQLWRRDGEAVARLRLAGAPQAAAWESCLQPLLAAIPGSVHPASTLLPTGFGRVRLYGELTEEYWSRVVLRPGGTGRTMHADVLVADPDGRLLAAFEDVRLRQAERGSAAPSRRPPVGSWRRARRLAATACAGRPGAGRRAGSGGAGGGGAEAGGTSGAVRTALPDQARSRTAGDPGRADQRPPSAARLRPGLADGHSAQSAATGRVPGRGVGQAPARGGEHPGHHRGCRFRRAKIELEANLGSKCIFL